jgi:hypothetical protein
VTNVAIAMTPTVVVPDIAFAALRSSQAYSSGRALVGDAIADSVCRRRMPLSAVA